MHAYIIAGGTLEEREKCVAAHILQWKISPFDVIHIEREEESVGIAHVRQFISSLQRKPRQSLLQAGIILEAERLTTTAQQALLKTLEEPPEAARIMLGIQNISQLLPTIISRCQVITLTTINTYSSQELDAAWELLKKLQTATIGERLNICTTLGKTKEELSAFISRAISAYHRHIVATAKPTPSDRALLHQLLKAKQYEATNINIALYLEHIFIRRNDINIV